VAKDTQDRSLTRTHYRPHPGIACAGVEEEIYKKFSRSPTNGLGPETVAFVQKSDSFKQRQKGSARTRQRGHSREGERRQPVAGRGRAIPKDEGRTAPIRPWK